MIYVVTEQINESVQVVRLNRPEHLNALNTNLVDELTEHFEQLGADRDCRVVILTGAGRAFCAGMDLADFAAGRMITRQAGPYAQYREQMRFSNLIRAVRALPQPVVAAVNGAAVGAGLGLILAADVRVAAPRASFHVGAVKVGLSAGECGISYHLPRQIGAARASEVMLTGRAIDADEAERIGLVSRLVAEDELMPTAIELARAIVANSPLGVAMTKSVARANLDATFEAALALEDRTQVLCAASDDFEEAIHAFLEHRVPTFRSR